jgi:hypothetical protein
MLASARAEAERLGASAIILEMDVRRVECLLLADEPAAALDAATALRARLAGEHEGDDELLTQLVALAAIASLRVGEVDSAEAAAAEALERARVESNHYLVAIALLVGAALDERAGRDATATRREALRLLEHLDVAGVPPVAHPLAAPFP